MQGNRASFTVDLGYTKIFRIPALTSVSFQTVTVFLGILWSYNKQINASYVFDWGHVIFLHAMQANLASSRGKGHGSWLFSSCSANLGYILQLQRGWLFKIRVVQQHQDSCLLVRQSIWTLLDFRRETEHPFLVFMVILGFLSVFKCQASSPFEALNFACLLRCVRDMRPPVQIRREHRAFYRVSTEDSGMPSCEMKDERAFKPLQGNPAFF